MTTRRTFLTGAAATAAAVATVPVVAMASNPDAELFAAAEALDRAWADHNAFCDDETDYHLHPNFRASLKAGEDAGFRFSQIPATTPKGLALKIKHLSEEMLGGNSAYGKALAKGALKDAERFLA